MKIIKVTKLGCELYQVVDMNGQVVGQHWSEAGARTQIMKMGV